MKLSVIMPVYNERNTLRTVVDRLLSVPLDMELICVDDGSRDGSREILSELQNQHPNLRVLLQPRNMGKGAALRRGIQQANGDFVVIQDADLEYDPADYPSLLDPLTQGKADVVYGSRFLEPSNWAQETRQPDRQRESSRVSHRPVPRRVLLIRLDSPSTFSNSHLRTKSPVRRSTTATLRHCVAAFSTLQLQNFAP
jgi:glycosyltransferase involved in cell wall biosynthesis